jgi:hypothetical protein
MENKDFAVAYLIEHRKELLEKRERLMRPIQELDQEIEHVTATLRSISPPTRVVAAQHRTEEFPIGKLRKLTQVQALVVIAKEMNGVIRAQEAKRLLIKAGVMRETKNSTNIIHAVILRSDKFERVRPGEYRLKETVPKPAESGLFNAPVQ